MAGRKSLFIFLMGLAWKCRFSMPLLLSGSAAVIGRAWMFQIRVHTVHQLRDSELAYYESDEALEDDSTWETESNDSWETIVEEVAYGSISTTIVQPADLVKTRMQLLGPQCRNMSALEVARRIVRRKGWKGLYAGYSAALVRQILYSGGRLGGFNAAFGIYKDEYKKVPNLSTKVALGMASGVFGAVLSMPPEVALIRMTADGRLPLDKRRNYKHVFDAIGRMVREEGAASLTRGFWATITRSMLLNGAQLATYAQSREALLSTMDDGVALHFSASMISGFVTTIVCLPVDMIKTRIQNSAKKDKTQLGVLRKIIRKQGYLALWSGFIPSYAKIGPHTVITFICLEQLGAYYLKHFAK